MPNTFTLGIVLLLVTTTLFAAETSRVTAKYDGGIVITAETEPFVPGKHKLIMCGDYLCIIDQHVVFGADGKMPSTQLTKLQFEKGGREMILDIRGMYEPMLNNNNLKTQIKVEPYWGELYKVTGRFSDGAGGYIAQWIVSPQGSTRTHLSDGESLIELSNQIQADH